MAFRKFVTKIIAKMPNHTLFIDILFLQVATWIQSVNSVLLVSSWLNPHCRKEAWGSISPTFWDAASSLCCVKYATECVLMMRHRIPRRHSSEIPNCADSSTVEEILGSTFCKVSVGLGLVLDGLTAHPLLPHRTEVLQDPNRHFLLLLKYLLAWYQLAASALRFRDINHVDKFFYNGFYPNYYNAGTSYMDFLFYQSLLSAESGILCTSL